MYLGKGGISTDSFDGQSGSIVRSIKMTEGTIGFYKGIYACGFVGVSDSNEIRMSLPSLRYGAEADRCRHQRNQARPVCMQRL